MKTFLIKACFFIVLLSLAACTTAPVSTSTSAPTAIPVTKTAAPPTEPAAPTLPPTATAAPSPTPTPLPYQWEQIYDGKAFPRDTVTTIVVDPTNAEILYVGTENSGVYKSVDGGKNWQPASAGLGNFQVQALVIDPQNPTTLYLGTQYFGVYKTSDGAQTWEAANQGFNLPMDMNSLVIDPQNPQRLYYAGWNGLFTSTNNGESWESLSNRQIKQLAINSQTGDLYAALHDQAGSIQSKDRGKTWKFFGPPNLSSANNIQPWQENVWVNSLDGATVYMTAPEGSGGSTNLFGTTDGGKTWQRYTIKWPFCINMTFGTQISHSAFCGCASGQVRQISTVGSNWSYLPRAGDDPVYSILFVPETNQLLAGSSGLYVTNYGGAQWTARNTGLGVPEMEFLRSPKPGELYLKVVNSRSDNSWLWDGQFYRSKDSGRSWSFFLAANELALDADGTTYYEIDTNNTPLRSGDGGKNWESILAKWPWPNNNPSTKIIANPNKPGYLFTFSDTYPASIYISPDKGSTWKGTNGQLDANFARIFFDPGNSDIVYAADRSKVIVSQDGGASWKTCRQISADLTETESALVIDPADNQRVFLATKWDGILSSADGCQTWQNTSEGLANLTVNTLAIDPNNSQTIYAGTDGGAYASLDGGQTWQPLNSGLPEPAVVYSIFVDEHSNVFAATPFGIYQLVK